MPLYCLFCYVLLAFIVLATSKQLIKFVSNNSTSVYPFVFIGFIIPVVSLFLQSLNYEFLSLHLIWLPGTIIAAFAFGGLLFTGINQSFRPIETQVVLMLGISCLFAFGSLRMINCQFDDSARQVFDTTIRDKWITTGKSTSYNILLGEWGQTQGGQAISVSKSFYNEVEPGLPVHVVLRQGALGMQWYYLAE